jgi:hypothetical protein
MRLSSGGTIMPKTIEQIRAEHESERGPGAEVAVVRLQISFGDAFILALQFGIVWFLMGLGGALLYRAFM